MRDENEIWEEQESNEKARIAHDEEIDAAYSRGVEDGRPVWVSVRDSLPSGLEQDVVLAFDGRMVFVSSQNPEYWNTPGHDHVDFWLEFPMPPQRGI